MTSLGVSPVEVPLYLSDNSDFIDQIGYESAPGVPDDYPVGATVTIAFEDSSATTWAATVSGSDASWHVDKALTATIEDGTRFQIQYVDGTADEVPFVGKVVRTR